MTRLWLFSDLHADIGAWTMPEIATDVDVIVAAGDIDGRACRSVERLAAMADGRPVVFVPGNHEWYATREPFGVDAETRRTRHLATASNVHMLMDEEVTLEGIRFLGATLRTDFALDGMPELSMQVARRSMNDYRLIRPFEGGPPLEPRDTIEWHRASRRFLEERLDVQHDGPTVVVTHHAPHRHSVAERYRDDALTPAFCSDLAPLVEGGGAALWVHGHTHTSFDYTAGSTRVLCNPKGYGPTRPGGMPENAAFDPALVIDL